MIACKFANIKKIIFYIIIISEYNKRKVGLAEAKNKLNIGNIFDSADRRITEWMARNGITLLRVALGIIFFWFGILKFFHNLSEAEDLAGRTISLLSFGFISPLVSVPILAAWECAIGLGLIFGKFLRFTLLLMFLQMPGTFLPLVFFMSETWKEFPYAPSLEGQYIIKNLVLLGAGIVIGATVRGGRITAESKSADKAEMR